jgi:hypothetical protein
LDGKVMMNKYGGILRKGGKLAFEDVSLELEKTLMCKEVSLEEEGKVVRKEVSLLLLFHWLLQPTCGF